MFALQISCRRWISMMRGISKSMLRLKAISPGAKPPRLELAKHLFACVHVPNASSTN